MERKRNTRLKESASDSQHSQEISEMEFGTPSNDILIEILSRVPDKPLARFKCVSKGWNNMICDPVFRKLQRQNSKAVISGFFFQLQDQHELSCQAKYVSINDKQVFVQHTILDFLPENVYVIGSSNGLLCCRNCWNPFPNPRKYQKVVYVCNPAIEKYVKVEGPKGLWTNSVDVIQGLGFFSNPFSYSMNDSSNFTLVWISKKVRFKSYSFHIYSSEIGGWRMSEEVCDCQSLIYNDSRSIFASGVLYWLTNQDEIVAFDVEEEKSMCIGYQFL
ncbi:hypothetical protein FRX31_022692 [Thalictrum thalictroides]|uniref:F-box domain-containing protein n=1 Tax=Thalictrum thalictroides TaxID=46969 RepID=A0A7J6VS61_THATH|nr:hypothetical protein FRX31_022692 [Thalictrum thalictroides]